MSASTHIAGLALTQCVAEMRTPNLLFLVPHCLVNVSLVQRILTWNKVNQLGFRIVPENRKGKKQQAIFCVLRALLIVCFNPSDESVS